MPRGSVADMPSGGGPPGPGSGGAYRPSAPGEPGQGPNGGGEANSPFGCSIRSVSDIGGCPSCGPPGGPSGGACLAGGGSHGSRASELGGGGAEPGSGGAEPGREGAEPGGGKPDGEGGCAWGVPAAAASGLPQARQNRIPGSTEYPHA